MSSNLPQALIEHQLFTAISTDFCLAMMMQLHRTDCLISSPPTLLFTPAFLCGVCALCAHSYYWEEAASLSTGL